MLDKNNSTAAAANVQNRFDSAIYHEVVPAIRTDCQTDDIDIVVTGASIGAFNALAAICRHPDVFSKAICMSGTYDLGKFMDGQVTGDYYESSPLHFLHNMPEGDHLSKLRERFVLLAHGEGRWEDPAQSWRAAEALGAKGVPNRVDPWGDEYDHDWPTWREMLPQYLSTCSRNGLVTHEGALGCRPSSCLANVFLSKHGGRHARNTPRDRRTSSRHSPGDARRFVRSALARGASGCVQLLDDAATPHQTGCGARRAQDRGR